MFASAKAGQAKSFLIPVVRRELANSFPLNRNPMENVLSTFTRDDPFIGREAFHA